MKSVKLYLRKRDGHLRHITWPRVIVFPCDGGIKITCQKFHSVVNAMAYRRCSSSDCSDRNTTTMTWTRAVGPSLSNETGDLNHLSCICSRRDALKLLQNAILR